MVTLSLPRSKSAPLFTDPTELADPLNWVSLAYGVPHAIISETGYYFSKDSCYAGMLNFGNDILGFAVFSEIPFTHYYDWFRYLIHFA